MMKKTKKNKKYKNKSIKNKLTEYEKILIDLYDLSQYHKIYTLFDRKLNKEEIQRFSLIYTLYRSGSHNSINGNKLSFKKEWFPESDEDSIKEATLAMESLKWYNHNKNEKKFYEMKEKNILYSDKKYENILKQLNFLKKKK